MLNEEAEHIVSLHIFIPYRVSTCNTLSPSLVIRAVTVCPENDEEDENVRDEVSYEVVGGWQADLTSACCFLLAVAYDIPFSILRYDLSSIYDVFLAIAPSVQIGSALSMSVIT